MKPSQLRDMTVDELQAKARELSEEIFHLKLRRTTGQLANPMKRREARRDLARVHTVLTARAGQKGKSK